MSMPSGVTTTKPGTRLRFGQSATVGYAPNPKHSTALRLRVVSVKRASIADLAAYQLSSQTAASTPYYVQAEVTNRGTGDVGGSAIPLWAVNTSNTLIQASSFTNTFRACPSQALPRRFAANAKVKACLVYLVPAHGRLTAMSFRPLQAVPGITWTGAITPAHAHKGKK
ncbi:MAG: hypothetical protein M3Z50_00905 [Actinomycetota bacterium]|nr:hypothetical protein [Actinomycetota bacterium]